MITNTMKSRTVGAISLGPAGNVVQGTYNFVSLLTWKVIKRRSWTKLPMPTEVIATLNKRALGERKRVDGRLLVRLGGKEIPDDDDEEVVDDDQVIEVVEEDEVDIAGVNGDGSYLDEVPTDPVILHPPTNEQELEVESSDIVGTTEVGDVLGVSSIDGGECR